MTILFTPKPHQKVIYRWLQQKKRSVVCSFMGSGKTSACLTALEDLSLTEDIYPILVIAPILVAETTWPSEVVKWRHLEHLKTSTITGTLKKREKALEEQADIYTTNYENLPWLIEKLGKNWKFKTVIADECTKLKGFRTRQGSVRAKALAKVAHTFVNRIILLTGTPAPNGILDLWGQIWFVDAGERLGKSFSKYCQKWFHTDYSGFNWLPNDNAQKEVQEAISDICLTIKAEDWFSLMEPIVNQLLLNLPSEAATTYKAMEKDMFAELEKSDVEAFSESSKSMKCRQIAAGALYLENSREFEELHDLKIQTLQSVIEENPGANILVAYHFQSDLVRLEKSFKQGVALNKDAKIEKAWNAGKIPLLFIHPASAGHGLNLQDGGNILVFFSCDWRLEEHLQVIERIGPVRQIQSGHNRNVFIYYLTMKGTIDETIQERLTTKKSVQEVLLNAMNKYKSRENRERDYA